MTIPQKTRDALLVEARHRCCRCMSDCPEVDLHHIVPQSQGGADEAKNLIVLCPTCHRLAHRYKFTKYQLLLYKKKSQEIVSQIHWYGRLEIPKDKQDISELLARLLEHAKSWYNDYVETVIAITKVKKQDDEELSQHVLKYIWSRHHLPDVVAIQGVLCDLEEFKDLSLDIEVFVRLLATADPLTGTYCCHVKPYWNEVTCEIAFDVYKESEKKGFASHEGIELLKSIESQLNMVVQEIYRHTAK